MAGRFVVELSRGPAWDDHRDRREQAGWEEHADFMDALVADGFVLFGGPLGDIHADEALLVVAADSEDAVRARLAGDPWADRILTIARVRPWTLWLGALPDT